MLTQVSKLISLENELSRLEILIGLELSVLSRVENLKHDWALTDWFIGQNRAGNSSNDFSETVGIGTLNGESTIWI